MAEVTRICPFTGKACRECAIYRGRHFYLYFEKGNVRCKPNMSKHSSIELRKAYVKEDETFKKLADISASPKIISDVENLVEKKEFYRFQEKGEKNDT